MLAGCSSTLLSSPRHRSSCHIPTMSTQRLDIPPCSFARKDGSRSQPVRPVVGLSIDNNIEPNKNSSLRQSIKLAPLATEKKKKKRFAAAEDEDSTYLSSRVKRKKGNLGNSDEEEGHFWFHHPQVPFSLSCSGDEERDCFLPVPPPLPPLSNIPWFDSVITEITDLGKTVDTVVKEASASGSSSSTSSGSQGLVLGSRSRVNQVAEHGAGNGSGSSPIPYPTEGIEAGGHNGEHNSHECIELISLVVACAEQIASKNIPAINHCLARLGELASPRGGTTIHRVIAYFTEALASRVSRLWPQIFHMSSLPTPREVDEDSGSALRALNQVSPIPKFIHFTSNEILLRAFQGKERIHIIDFDIKQGLQWPGLFQSLATRAGGRPAHVRITGVGESKQELIETGDRLAGFAEAFDLAFEFHPVVDRLEDVRLWMLHVKEKETVAVNCVFQLHKMLYEESALKDFLGLIRSTNAEVLLMGEQEGAHNDATLDARLYNSLRYYSAVFDSIDSSLPINSPARVKIEEEIFGREIRNIIACEGRERHERHVGFDTWRELMEGAGFRCRGVTEREVLQGRMMLKMYEAGAEEEEERYTVEMRGGAAAITLRWLDEPLYTVSAWELV